MYLGGIYVRVVYERVWRELKMCAIKGVSWLDLATDSRLESRQSGTHVKHAGNWRVTTVRALQDKMYSLARQLARDLNLRLVPVARLSRQNALFGWKLTFYISHIHYYKYPYPTKCRRFLERILREKPYKKTRLTHLKAQKCVKNTQAI